MEASKQNISLIFADGLGLDLGNFGTVWLSQLQLDARGARSVSFDDAFCATASCSSSRSLIYSGRTNHEIRNGTAVMQTIFGDSG